MQLFHKAERKKGRLRLAIAGPAGSGKTYSALLIALGIGGKIALIDTERGSGELYDHLGEYDVCGIEPPFKPQKYIEAIRVAEENGYNVIILDSISHAWAGQGGLLDTHGHIADESGNSWAAWRQITPKHDELVEAMLQSRCHVIATMRSKMEYAQVEEDGKKRVKKLGMSPIQRNGMEYEFTTFIDLGQNHVATTSKDRTGLFDDQYFVPTAETGKRFLEWLEGGKDIPEPGPKQEGKEEPPDPGQGEKKGRTPQAAPNRKGGNGSGLRHLFTRIAEFNLPKNGYRLYCHNRYRVESLRLLTPEQLEEQSRLLDSLRRPARLEEFRELLDQISAGSANGKKASSEASASEGAEEAVPSPEAGEPDGGGNVPSVRPKKPAAVVASVAPARIGGAGDRASANPPNGHPVDMPGLARSLVLGPAGGFHAV